MPRATYEGLIAQVRAQIAVDPDTAWAWLLDRSQVLNAEAAWNIDADAAESYGDPDGRYYLLPDDLIWLEAVLYGDAPYQRSTPTQLDARWTGNTGNTSGVYALGPTTALFQIHPPVTGELTIRFVREIPELRSAPPPFPVDFDQALVDGAVAIGLARMDERFDSAGYFDAKFGTAIERLRRRRHALAGRGATAIRVVQ